MNYKFKKKRFGQEIWWYLKKFPIDLRVNFTKFRTVIINYQLKLEGGITQEDVLEFVHCVIKTHWVRNTINDYVMELQAFSAKINWWKILNKF